MDLIQAAYKGDVVEVKRLINQGADVNAKDNDGRTALVLAAHKGHVEVVRALLNRGADVNTKDNGGWTALMGAAHNNHINVSRLLEAEEVWCSRKALLAARYSE